MKANLEIFSIISFAEYSIQISLLNIRRFFFFAFRKNKD